MTDRTLTRALLALYTAFVFLFIFAPIIASFVFSFNSDRFPTIPLGSFTTHWYEKAFGGDAIWPAAQTSLLVSVCTAVLATFIGFSAAYTDYRYDFFGKKAFLVLALLPPTIPLWQVAIDCCGSRVGQARGGDDPHSPAPRGNPFGQIGQDIPLRLRTIRPVRSGADADHPGAGFHSGIDG